MTKKNPPDATRKEIAELRKRVKVLERKVESLDRVVSNMLLKQIRAKK